MKKIIIVITAIGFAQCVPNLQPKPATYVEYECKCELYSVTYEFLEGSEEIEEIGSGCIEDGCNWIEL